MPSVEKAYFSTFQNWTEWLDKKIVDNVVAMNYTDDMEIFKLYSSSLMMKGFQNKIQMGVGSYIMKDNNEITEEQIKFLKTLPLGGIVIFSYDDIVNNDEIKDFLAVNFKRPRKLS